MTTLKRSATWISLGGLALALVALAARVIIGSWALWMQILLGIGGVLILSFALLAPQKLKRWLGGRQARYGSNAVVMMLALAAILVIANSLAADHEKRWDVTEEGLYTLSQQSVDVINLLEEPVDIKLFYTGANYMRADVETLMKEYAAQSDLINYEFIDPDTDRMAATTYGISRDGTTLFLRGERQEVTFGSDESDLTSTLLKVTRDEQSKVYFVTGNGERGISDYETSGLDSIAEAMTAEFYNTHTLNLSIEPVPADADLVILAAPSQRYDDREIQYLSEYMATGGSLMVLFEPGEQPELEAFLANYGILTPDTMVIDVTNGFYGDVATPIVDTYAYHQITNDLAGLTSVFSTVRGIQADTAREDWNVTLLTTTSDYSWAERDYMQGEVEQNNTDLAGPVGMAAAAEPAYGSEAQGRLVVFGDADMVSNDMLSSIRGTANVDLFMNAAAWLTQDDVLLSISPAVPEDRTIQLSGVQSRLLMYTNLIVVPLLVLLLGVVVWWRRR